MIIALVVVILFFYWRTGGTILLPQNINNLFSQNAYVFVLGTGMLMCILTGGNIDLSVGSVVCFTGGIGAVMMDKNISAVLAVIVMLAVGLVIGMFQGFWIAYVSVPPFIATLAGMYAFRGLSNVVLNGYLIGVRNEAFLNVFGGGADCYVPDFIGKGGSFNLTCMIAGAVIAVLFVVLNVKTWITRKVKGYTNDSMTGEIIKVVILAALILYISYKLSKFKGIPSVVLWILAVLLIYNYISQRTAIGRYLYAVGGNRKATELSGVNTKRVFFIAYANMGLLAGLAGILTLARAVQGNPTFGQGYEMDAIAACFIGGASAYGGIGSVSGTVVGAVLLGVINQGMSIMGVSTNYQSVVKGLVLLIAVLFDVVSKKKE
ncbi:MAG: sugar ABC transporter permease [Lachnospiraceae bacterium]|nr:sugar ABC transporter permease [Lachnospiraceae bacterium]